jgi:hypothetical protein
MKKIILTAALVLLTARGLAAMGWMSRVADSVGVEQMSIPGSHDSATGCGTTCDSLARTQEVDIAAQFDAGVRAYDFRPSSEGNTLRIYHGLYATDATFEEALDTLVSKLEKEPTEFVVIVMRHEDTHESQAEKAAWAPMMKDLLNNYKHRDRLIDFRPGLTAGDMRGRILILSRDKYGDTPVGAYIDGWAHDADFASQGKAVISGRGRAALHVQDFYDTYNALDTKFESIVKVIDYSQSPESAGKWIINHASGYYSPSTVTVDAYRANAAMLNGKVARYLGEGRGRAGIIMMDFAGADISGDSRVDGQVLIDAIIERNFR